MRRAWLLLVFAASLALWLWRSPREETPDNQASGARHAAEPGYAATGAVMLETDADGRPLYRLRAERIAQPDPTADIEMSAPQFEYEGSTRWTLTAHSGVLPPTAQQISLSGDVVGHADRVGAEPIQIRSASLQVDMLTRRADTSDAVTMDWGSNRLWAAGLHADMQADTLRLISPVYGEFAQVRK